MHTQSIAEIIMIIIKLQLTVGTHMHTQSIAEIVMIIIKLQLTMGTDKDNALFSIQLLPIKLLYF